MSLDVQLTSLLASIAMGVGLATSLDTYERILGKRTSFRKTRIVNDFLFWVAQALIYFGILLHINHGEVRVYLLLAVMLGYALYRALFETTYRRILESCLRIIHHIIHFIVRCIYIFLINPTKGLLKLLGRLGMMLTIAIWKIVSTLLIWVFRPILMVVRYTDIKCGQPFIKHRKRLRNQIKSVRQRFLSKKKK
ncbi:spore cortex biosynthesis protein YabQ [Salipaludibacillus keqinensis]|uniref:Spore cortex biosynthesis protein YabQ n=1 Tax=Salipaludibacillus keqinensis TaxID=2045207 RepID=A0A323TQH9_9BACI|nr:spore cortex biosynthesis protein YabQ [Salipaludibacillus keqinensis]PYZ91555.1 spore cortex biosynthesis protein YabQ [Salipaludibacillus keqinensis]